jgi:LacI family transcriptional regulator
MSPRSRPTLADVARLADVSSATVSRTLSRPNMVDKETRDRVLRCASEVGYVIADAARTLASGRSMTIGVIVPTIAFSIFAPGVEAIERFAERQGYGIIIVTTGYDLKRELEQVRRLVGRGVDGLVLYGLDHDPGLRPFLEARGVPYVCQGAYAPGAPHPCIGFDNRQAIGLTVEHLLALGHCRVGILGGIPDGNDRVRDRIAGAVEKLAHAGHAPTGIAHARYDLTEGRVAARSLLDRPDRPTAIVAINDVLALAACFEAAALGLDVPRDVSVTGFDDIDFAAHFEPRLTTINVPVGIMGVSAVEALIRAIEADAPIEARRLDVQLVVRGSTAAAAA